MTARAFRNFDEIPRGQYGVIYADPPWYFKTWGARGTGRGALSHYDLMSAEELRALPVGDLAAKDCMLFLWVPIPMRQQGMALLETWGFRYRWQRALLSIGDYLLPSGRQNISFLVNSSTEQASWKRLLRGTGPKVPEARKLLHQLWDRLTPGEPMKEQLDQIIAAATTLENWREAFVRTPEAIDYCGYQAIRWNAPDEVYLLKKSQMNGAHAELFSFCLFEKVLRPLSNQGRLAPLILRDYQQAIGTDFEPHISMAHEGSRLGIKVEFRKGDFVISVDGTWLQTQPDIAAILIDSLGFIQDEGRLLKSVSPTAIESTMLSLAQAVAKTSQTDSSHG